MQNRRKLSREEYARMRQQRMLRRRIASMTILGIAVVVIASLCFMFMAPAFNIKNVVCEGNEKTSSEAIIQTAAIQTGKNIFLTGFGGARNNVEDMEFIINAEIKRQLPNTVRIIVSEEQPSAYFSVGSQLALTDLSGNVIEVISNPNDAEQIINSKISQEEPEPTSTPEPKEETTVDDMIWGYDDDGDPIYKVNGGHYEFDDDGNRYFVDDSASAEESASPESTPAADTYVNPSDIKYDELPKTDEGKTIYYAPIVYGVNISTFEQGKRIKSDDESKLESVIGIIQNLKTSNLLERTTKIDVENPTDVRVYIEDRLEILFGGFDDFEYKTRFVASVINENLTKYEHAVLDFRDSKLYVRSTEKVETILNKPTATPSSEDEEDSDDESEEASPSPKPKKSASSDASDSDSTDDLSEDEEDSQTANKSRNTNSDVGVSSEAKHTPTPKVGKQN